MKPASRQDEAWEPGTVVLEPGGPSGTLFTLHGHEPACAPVAVGGPTFEVAGEQRGAFVYVGREEERTLARGGREVSLRYRSPGDPVLDLLTIVRGYPDSPVLRLRYTLVAGAPTTLTKRAGGDNLGYLTLRGADIAAAREIVEIQLSHFDPVAHSYLPNIERHPAAELYEGQTLAGPIVIALGGGAIALAAYEHGADHPQSFLEFAASERDGGRGLALRARMGNYYDGQPLGPDAPWESVWLELAVAGPDLDSLLRAYRTFFLQHICENTESRRPYLYYNTWNYQERNHYFRGRPYLESMVQERIAAEVEVAARLGLDVFVIDTGWYSKTGDWEVDRRRFPDGLAGIKAQLDRHGMKLGLWFNPTVAALTSRVHQSHPEWTMTRGDGPPWRGEIWETEMSTRMCLASPYAGYFVETMVRLHQELGVRYFKWDAVAQWDCDSPHHQHGTAANTREERAACYAYEMGRAMIRIVEEATRRCPGIIVDFDITEGGRFVGLGFLSVGKYFLVNNGPYFSDFDIPPGTRIDPDTINVFFYPGPARTRICRTGLRYDGVIPSILFLTHYLPDPPALSQRNSLAALMLGGNGIWGDLLALSDEEIASFTSQLASYKDVAGGVTRSYPRVRGFAGSSPEIHEKIDPSQASGMIAFFTVAPGTFTHITAPLGVAALREVRGADAWEIMGDGRLKVTVTLGRDDARVVYVVGAPALPC